MATPTPPTTLRRPREGRARTAAAMLRGELTWRARSQVRSEALRMADAVFGATRWRADLRSLAHRQVVEHAVRDVRDEVGLDPSVEVVGLDRWEAARAANGGRAMLATLHVGQIADVTLALAVRGHRFALPWGAWTQSDHPAVRRRADLALGRFAALGCENVVATGGGFARFEAALDRGDAVSMPFDVPGSTPTRFLGRDLRMASGGSRLAWARRLPVLPGVWVRRGVSSHVEVREAIEPDGFADEAAFRAAILAEVERALVDHAPAADLYALYALFGEQLEALQSVPAPADVVPDR